MESFGSTRLPQRFSLTSKGTDSFRDFRPPVRLDSFVGEKIKQLEQIADNIKANKEEYLKKYLDLNKTIEFKTNQIYFGAQARKQELEGQLEEIMSSEVLSWDRQLKICEKAEEWLKNLRMDCPPFGENLQEMSNLYAKDIGFITSPEISFDDSHKLKWNNIQNIKNVSCRQIIQDKGTIKTKAKFYLGKEGQNVGEFKRPWGVCTDAMGRIFVADQGNNRIQIFNQNGRFLLKFGKMGNGAGDFNQPAGITVDKKCRIIVSDRNNHRIQVFTFNGMFMYMFGQRGYKPGQFHYPCDVDTNSEGDIAVCDAENHRVQLFNGTGVFITQFKFKGYSLGLNKQVCLFGLAFKPDDTLLVTDIKNRIVFEIDQKFFTVAKIHDCPKIRPQGVACTRSGKFAVGDGKGNTILIFDDQEKPKVVFLTQANYLGKFKNPHGICFLPNGRLVVADYGNNRIQVFQLSVIKN